MSSSSLILTAVQGSKAQRTKSSRVEGAVIRVRGCWTSWTSWVSTGKEGAAFRICFRNLYCGLSVLYLNTDWTLLCTGPVSSENSSFWESFCFSIFGLLFSLDGSSSSLLVIHYTPIKILTSSPNGK